MKQAQTITQLFQAQAEKRTDATAVVFEGQRLSYYDLNARANQLAHHLRSLGFKPDTPAGLCVERSPEMMIGLLGILKAGGAYLPLDPTYPQERLAFMIDDAAPPVIVTQSALRPILPTSAARIVSLDTETFDHQPTTNPTNSTTPDNLAYIIYTSGSTGKPKGVPVPHRGLYNVSQAQIEMFGLTSDDRVLQFASLNFDAATFEILMAWGVGATLFLGTREGLAPGKPLQEFLAQRQISIVTLTPSTLAALPVTDLPALHTITVAGEACPASLAQQWGVGRRFFNLYGPTEASIWTTAMLCDETNNQPPPIGRPIINNQVYILDPDNNPVPEGEAGELCIGGVGVTRGYLNRPELTAEKFIPNPFDEGRLYKTGDLARYLPDGNIEFLGRIDHQVKIRGFRIELGEIEATLDQHPSVHQSLVVATQDASGIKRLVAYIIPSQGVDWSGRQMGNQPGGHLTVLLRQYLRQKLPDYMVPAAFVALQAFPLTPNDKIDRQALPAPPQSRPDLANPLVNPRTPTEEVLVGMSIQLLGIDQVGVEDNLFELGADSLLITQFVARVRETFDVDLPLRNLFEQPTIAATAQAIETPRQRIDLPKIKSVAQTDDSEIKYAPLTFAQERVWFLLQLAPTNIAYHAQATIRLTGALDVAALEQSINEIVRRHEMYRTTFPTVEGKPVQYIHPHRPFQVPFIDLRSEPKTEQAAKLQTLLMQEYQTPFEVTQLPLARWTIYRLDEQEHILSLMEHHFVHDGWSFVVFLRELCILYNAFTQNQTSPLLQLPLQFADYARWEREWLRGEALKEQLAYWTKKLANHPPALALPTDYPRPEVKSFKGGAVRVQLSEKLSRDIRALSRQERVTLYMTLLAAFKTLLYRYTAQEDILVGSGVANRRFQETESIIGMIINTIVLRTDLSGNPTFQKLLERVRDVTLEAYNHQNTPFDKIVEAIQVERNLNQNPLFQVMFGIHDTPIPAEVIPPGLEISLTEAINNGSAKFDLSLVVIPRSDKPITPGVTEPDQGITLIWEYSSDLFTEATIRRLAGHFQMLLESIVADPQQPIAELPLLMEAERDQLLVGWNQTQTDYPRDKRIHHLFEAQVERAPDAIALVFAEQQLTYRQLNERANQLAHHLQALGVGPDTLVGLRIERSIEVIIGVLAILKAGGAYVPLDPAYPAERLAFMLADTQTPLLLTHSSLVEKLPPYDCQIVCLDTDWSQVEQQNANNLTNRGTAQDLAYVMYTSGSTGHPKGVCVTHRNVVRLVKNTNYAQLTANETFLQFAPISFDAATLEIWGPLLNGGRLVIFPAQMPSLETLGEIIQQHQITTLWLTAGLFHQMVDSHLDKLRGVRQLLAGGDVLSVPHVQKALAQLPHTCLINGYGPTENTTFTTCYPMTSGASLGSSVPIGQPIANTQVYILDARMQPVPIGVPGELYTGGDGVAHGYLNRSELTAEKFIPDPFSDDPDARLYKTGDLARYLPDGNIEFLGRFDNQVKIRGFRIELGEIETVLSQHPAVEKCVVIAREDRPGEKRLVAYVVSHQSSVNSDQPSRPDGESDNTSLLMTDLRQYLKERVPDYMIPSAFVMMDDLPLNPNGKVDRNILPAPQMVDFQVDNEFVTPTTPTEVKLAGIWTELLDLKQVGIHDNFFDLGGHSLLATQVVTRIHQAFQTELTLVTLFEVPTVAELSKIIEKQQANHPNTQISTIKPISRAAYRRKG